MSKQIDKIFVTEEKEVINSISCDFCGKTIDASDVFDLDNVFATIKWTAGFGSSFDMTTFELHICDECLDKHSKLKINHLARYQ
jgi:hypothetical protein